jgi:hypothetical protein
MFVLVLVVEAKVDRGSRRLRGSCTQGQGWGAALYILADVGSALLRPHVLWLVWNGGAEFVELLL